ncbi:5'-3' exonuclease [Staphylococcus lutrae]|uniref:5'-3' exonuclease n=1 Tax=Staphylococcus lutrae TaxID=155085 RepID=A0AAC9WKI5_9STAP|nr:5'-3' exonuclease H3TH domain-containing protein [Staphylococcus lutrae]ARJ51856.1 flap endonuclease [Staphylococcus lutrae]PNZ36097.1 flap endonuclease [Staphylococcus lutrae]
MTQKLLLIDGMALLFRHFYATSVHKNFMRNTTGVPTNGTQGFVRHVYSAIRDIEPTHIAVCWDMGKTTFRNTMFDGYKQNRPAPPEELIPQFGQVQHISNALGFLNVGVENYEADDIIGTLSHAYAQSSDHRVYIITGDRDLLQCVNDQVSVWLIKKGFNEYHKYDLQRFEQEYGLQPSQLIDVKAFMGDSADGYPGVKGIGEKTAIKLIQQYGSVEEVVDNLSALTAAQQKKITQDLTSLHLSKQLATIECHVPLSISNLFEQMAHQVELNHVLSVLDQHELFVSKQYILNL